MQRHWARPGAAPSALFRARRRRLALTARRGAAREPPWAAEGWGRRRPDAPPWCGCFSSLTSTPGAGALSAAWGISLDYVPRAAASLGSNSGAWSSTRAPMGAAGGGRRRPGASLWCGCCSSPTPVLGAAGPGSTYSISMGFVPRTEAPLGTSSVFCFLGVVLLSPLCQSTPQEKSDFFQLRNFNIMAT